MTVKLSNLTVLTLLLSLCLYRKGVKGKTRRDRAGFGLGASPVCEAIWMVGALGGGQDVV